MSGYVSKSNMSLLWLSIICATILVVLLVLGERTLPLFGGNRELAGRVYKTAFMVLGTGLVVGIIHTMFGIIAGFLRYMVGSLNEFGAPHPVYQMGSDFISRYNIPGVLELVAPWFAAVLGIGGLVMAAFIWATE